MPRVVPTGYWTKSTRHRLEWVFNRVAARRRAAIERKAVARWEARLRRALVRMLERVDWVAWARRRTITKAIGFSPDLDVADMPELDTSELEEMVGALWRDAGRTAWAHGSRSNRLPFPEEDFEKGMAATFGHRMKDVGDFTSERMRGLMRESMEGEASFAGFAAALRRAIPSMAAKRAHLIAVTEYRTAASTATQSLAEAQGDEEKHWNTAGDDEVCPGCLSNESAGWIELGEAFPEGDAFPPHHPGCRCNHSTR